MRRAATSSTIIPEEAKIERNMGQAIGNRKLQSKGAIPETRGKLQKTVGDIRSKIAGIIGQA